MEQLTLNIHSVYRVHLNIFRYSEGATPMCESVRLSHKETYSGYVFVIDANLRAKTDVYSTYTKLKYEYKLNIKCIHLKY